MDGGKYHSHITEEQDSDAIYLTEKKILGCTDMLLFFVSMFVLWCLIVSSLLCLEGGATEQFKVVQSFIYMYYHNRDI